MHITLARIQRLWSHPKSSTHIPIWLNTSPFMNCPLSYSSLNSHFFSAYPLQLINKISYILISCLNSPSPFCSRGNLTAGVFASPYSLICGCFLSQALTLVPGEGAGGGVGYICRVPCFCFQIIPSIPPKKSPLSDPYLHASPPLCYIH